MTFSSLSLRLARVARWGGACGPVPPPAATHTNMPAKHSLQKDLDQVTHLSSGPPLWPQQNSCKAVRKHHINCCTLFVSQVRHSPSPHDVPRCWKQLKACL